MRLPPAPRRRRAEQGTARTGAMLGYEGGAMVQNIVVDDGAILGKIGDRLTAPDTAEYSGLVVA